MTHCRLLTAALSLTLVASLGPNLWADHRLDPHDEISRHAADLIDHSRELYDEIRLHFRGHPATAHALGDVLNLLRSSRRMLGYAEAHASFGAMEREASRMEDAFHHLQETLGDFGHAQGGHHGGARHVREAMRCIDVLVHEIHDDVHRLRHRPVYAPVIPTGDLRPGDWYFGGGSFSIRSGR